MSHVRLEKLVDGALIKRPHYQAKHDETHQQEAGEISRRQSAQRDAMNHRQQTHRGTINSEHKLSNSHRLEFNDGDCQHRY